MEVAADMVAAPSLSALLADGTVALAAAGIASARLDAEVLLGAVCGVARTALYVRGDEPVRPAVQRAFTALVQRRRCREPLQYIVGRQEFWSLDFVVTPQVLIPRPETELLVELAIARRPLSICDLGTGSGCLAIALATELPDAEIWAIDRSGDAVDVARENARRHGAERIHFAAGDLFAPVAGRRFDLIVCNPPYIATGVLKQLQPELAWEPRGALDGGAEGLDVIRRVLAAVPAHLATDGWLMMEIGADQERAVRELAHDAGLRDVSVRSDYAGLPRVLLAKV